jgi:acyl-CoA thioesterase-1
VKVLFVLLFSFNLFAVDKVLFLGDSLTAGYGVEKNDAFPKLVGDKFEKAGNKIKVINAGISGSTTSGALKRLRWYLKAKPDVVFLALGANDGLRGLKLQKSKENLDEVIKLAKKKKIEVVLAGMMLPPNYGAKYRKEFEQMYKDLAKEHKLHFIPFLLKGVGGEAKLNQADGIHPNEQGHKVIADTVYSKLKEVL